MKVNTGSGMNEQKSLFAVSLFHSLPSECLKLFLLHLLHGLTLTSFQFLYYKHALLILLFAINIMEGEEEE